MDSRRDYMETRPQMSDYMPEGGYSREDLRQARRDYDGEGPYWRSDAYKESDWGQVQSKYGEAMQDWRQDMPSWDDWNQ